MMYILSLHALTCVVEIKMFFFQTTSNFISKIFRYLNNTFFYQTHIHNSFNFQFLRTVARELKLLLDECRKTLFNKNFAALLAETTSGYKARSQLLNVFSLTCSWIQFSLHLGYITSCRPVFKDFEIHSLTIFLGMNTSHGRNLTF